MFRVLVTGFEPFNNAKLNPSEELVRSLKVDDVPGAHIITAVLPVVYSKAAESLLALIEEHQPDAVICFGQAEGRKSITPERFAVNLDDASISDNSGSIRIDHIIQSSGETAYSSTLPVKELVAAVNASGVPASLSLSAGTFVCNHIFYEMQHALRGKSILSGFVHVPLMTEQANDFPGLFTMELDQMVLASKALIETLLAKNQNE
jgi:pyroglutamyl-peptidase